MRSSTPVTIPSGWSSSARSRCSGRTSVWPRVARGGLGGRSASVVLRVKRWGSSGISAYLVLQRYEPSD